MIVLFGLLLFIAIVLKSCIELIKLINKNEFPEEENKKGSNSKE